jgi:hypothetical protein
VVNRELTLGPTGTTAAAVALEHGLALAGEAEAGVRLPRIADPAQAGAKQLEAAAGAEKPGLPIPPRQEALREGSAGDPVKVLYRQMGRFLIVSYPTTQLVRY